MTKDPNIALMVMTHGRRDYIVRTVESARENLLWEFSPKIIVDDSGNPAYSDWLKNVFQPEFAVFPTSDPLGFCGSIQRGWNLLVPSQADYVFHLEDDFVFAEQIRVKEMVEILDETPELAQLALLRQPWNPKEKAAGGVIQLYDGDFRECLANGHVWVEHCRFFTTNPCLYPIAIARRPYPQEDFCEGKFSIALRNKGFRFGILGRKTQKPKAIHIGQSRGPHWKWK